MARRKAFLIRIDPRVHAALERWAADELRSVNGQIEYLLRQSVKTHRRTPDLELPKKGAEDDSREST